MCSSCNKLQPHVQYTRGNTYNRRSWVFKYRILPKCMARIPSCPLNRHQLIQFKVDHRLQYSKLRLHTIFQSVSLQCGRFAEGTLLHTFWLSHTATRLVGCLELWQRHESWSWTDFRSSIFDNSGWSQLNGLSIFIFCQGSMAEIVSVTQTETWRFTTTNFLKKILWPIPCVDRPKTEASDWLFQTHRLALSLLWMFSYMLCFVLCFTWMLT